MSAILATAWLLVTSMYLIYYVQCMTKKCNSSARQLAEETYSS